MRKTILDISSRKGPTQEPLVCLTAYTAPMARALDPHCDVLLVGDSVAMVLYGEPTTLQADLDMMVRHGRAVVRASQKALVVVDMPFGSYQEGREQAFRNAALVLRETGASSVKMEGGAEMAETIRHLSSRGVPVMGHVGLMPQSVNAIGGFRVQGREDDAARKILEDAKAVAAAGAFALVLEGVPEPLAAEITKVVPCPVIGIGASAKCDGQILVAEDMLGMTRGPRPKFVKAYAELDEAVGNAAAAYAKDVKMRAFPVAEHVYQPVRITATQTTPVSGSVQPPAPPPSVPAETPLPKAAAMPPASKPPAATQTPAASTPPVAKTAQDAPQKATPPISKDPLLPPGPIPVKPAAEDDKGKDDGAPRPFFDTVLRATRRS